MLKIRLSVALQTFRSVPSLSSSFRHLSLSPNILADKAVTVELPKKPRTPWINFYTKNFPVFKKSFPTLTNPELMHKISKEWANVPNADKSKLQEFYKKEKEAYMAEVPHEQIDNIKAPKKLNQMKKENKDIEKQTRVSMKLAKSELQNLLTSLDKPKRPLSSFLLYSMEKRPTLSTTLSSSEKMKLMGEEWRQAGKQTKAVYEKKNTELVENYKVDMDRWSMKMQEEGMDEEIAMAQMRLAKAKKDEKDEGGHSKAN